MLCDGRYSIAAPPPSRHARCGERAAGLSESGRWRAEGGEQSHAHYKALLTAGVCADWRGKLVVPRGLAVDAHGCVDLKAFSRVH